MVPVLASPRGGRTVPLAVELGVKMGRMVPLPPPAAGGAGGQVPGGGGMPSDVSGTERLLVNFSSGGVRNCFSSSVIPVKDIGH